MPIKRTQYNQIADRVATACTAISASLDKVPPQDFIHYMCSPQIVSDITRLIDSNLDQHLEALIESSNHPLKRGEKRWTIYSVLVAIRDAVTSPIEDIDYQLGLIKTFKQIMSSYKNRVRDIKNQNIGSEPPEDGQGIMPPHKWQEIFQFDAQNPIFKEAIKPKSLGGTEQFEFLALLGNNVRATYLVERYGKKGVFAKGVLNDLLKRYASREAHNRLGKHLNLQAELKGSPPEQHDHIGECVEALVGAAYQVHGMQATAAIDDVLHEIQVKLEEEDPSGPPAVNWRGQLLECFQGRGLFPLPIMEAVRVGGLDHDPRFQCAFDVTIDGQTYHAEGAIFSNKPDAIQDAARNMLGNLREITLPAEKLPESHAPAIPEEPPAPVESLTPRTSIIKSEIIFREPGALASAEGKTPGLPPKLDPIGQSLLEWATKKAHKDPYGLLVELSARVPDSVIAGKHWITTLDEDILVLLHLRLGSDEYFELGMGKSNNKARQDAARTMIENAGVFTFLGEHFGKLII